MIIGLYDDDIGISQYQPAHLLSKFKLLVVKGAPTYVDIHVIKRLAGRYWLNCAS